MSLHVLLALAFEAAGALAVAPCLIGVLGLARSVLEFSLCTASLALLGYSWPGGHVVSHRSENFINSK